MSAGAEDGVFGDHHDAIAHHPASGIQLGAARKWQNGSSSADMGIFIDNRPFNVAIIADPKRDAFFFHILGAEKPIIIGTHQDAVFDDHSRADLAAQSDHGMGIFVLP